VRRPQFPVRCYRPRAAHCIGPLARATNLRTGGVRSRPTERTSPTTPSRTT
jgi:hypothetical protein